MMDLAWASVRMTQLKLFEVDLFLSEKQTVHGWRSFIEVVHSCVPVQKKHRVAVPGSMALQQSPALCTQS